MSKAPHLNINTFKHFFQWLAPFGDSCPGCPPPFSHTLPHPRWRC